MRKIIIYQTLCFLLFSFLAKAQTDPNNQVNVYFKTGVTRVPPAYTTASITSGNVLNVLNTYSIPASNVRPSFPLFNEADTVNGELGEDSRQMNRAKSFYHYINSNRYNQ